MDWLGTVGLVIAIATGLAGTVLGVRAELRASRYRPLWTIESSTPVSFHNRTGEDATDVQFRLKGGRFVAGPTQFAMIADGQAARVYLAPADPEVPAFHVDVYWTRPSSGVRYVYPRRHRWPGGVRDRSKVFAGDYDTP